MGLEGTTPALGDSGVTVALCFHWKEAFPVLWGEGSQGPWWAEIKGSLTETEEQRVHAHAIDAEEAVSDQVGANDHCLFKRKHRIPASSREEQPHPITVLPRLRKLSLSWAKRLSVVIELVAILLPHL